MTRLEKILMGVLLLALVATVVFWEDVSGLLSGNTSTTADDQKSKDGKKDDRKKDKKKSGKDKDKKANDDEAFSPTVPYPAARG